MKNVGNWKIFEYLVILWDILEFVDIFAHRNWRKFYDFGRILWLLLIISAVLRFFKILGYLLTSRMFQIKESFGILVIIKTLSGRSSKILEDSWRFLKILEDSRTSFWQLDCLKVQLQKLQSSFLLLSAIVSLLLCYYQIWIKIEFS